MSDHWKDCWLQHPACATIRIRELEREVLSLKQSCFDTHSGSILTHPTVVPCGSVGPTWSSPHDDPPSHTI